MQKIAWYAKEWGCCQVFNLIIRKEEDKENTDSNVDRASLRITFGCSREFLRFRHQQAD